MTESTEMHLITIYRLTEEQQTASIGDIAAMLGIHHSSVSEKVKRLKEQGLVQHEHHEGVSLTEDGRRIAISVLRKHRLVKTFLVQMAAYPIDEVYDEACQLEHVISDRLADRLEEMLGNPQVDPHGYPIPDRDGSVAVLNYRSLNDHSPGETVVIRRVDALQQDKLTYLRQLGLTPGTQVKIEEIAPFDGPLTLVVGEQTVVIAPSLAQEIEVSDLTT
jgi:DtxR family transcriptional regulator, Mn-dependent transcriptional regulator